MMLSLGLLSFRTWIYHSVPALLIMLSILFPRGSDAAVSNIVLTSSPYRLTLSFEPNPSATNYTASFRIYNSWVLNDVALDPPYNVSLRTVSYDKVSPGLNYTVELYENETNKDSLVFSQHISTVPLAPINVEVEDRDTSYLYIAWDSVQNITYSSHRIYFRAENESKWEMETGTAEEFYTLQGLVSGYVYEVNVTAIAYDFTEDKESAPSVTISSPTLPAPPTNISAKAENTTHIVVTWTPQVSSYQDSFLVQYLLQGTNYTASCQESPCSFAPGPPAGQEVIIYVSSVSHEVPSKAGMTKCSTEPDPVSNLKADEGMRSLNLSWEVPASADITSYHIRVVKIADNSTKEYKKDAGKDDSLVFYTVSSLLGGSVYQVFVSAETPYASGEPKTAVFKTATTEPFLVFDSTLPPTTTTPAPRETDSPIHHDFFCDITHMSIHIPISLLPNSKLTLKDPVCVLKKVGTNYVLDFKFDECGSSVAYFTDVVYISNEINVHKDLGSFNSPIVLDTDFKIPLKCSLNRTALIEGGFQTVTREPIIEIEDNSDKNKYVLYTLREFKTAAYKEEITDYPVQIPINREIFMELSVNESKAGFGIEIERCYATPTADPKDSTSYTLLAKGCPASAVVHMIPSSTTRRRRFKVQAFHFGGAKNDHDKVYIHCQVHYCTQCETDDECSNRRKRSLGRLSSSFNKPRYTRRARGNERNIAVSLGPIEVL